MSDTTTYCTSWAEIPAEILIEVLTDYVLGDDYPEPGALDCALHEHGYGISSCMLERLAHHPAHFSETWGDAVDEGGIPIPGLPRVFCADDLAQKIGSDRGLYSSFVEELLEDLAASL
jgi:hypothetical protein